MHLLKTQRKAFNQGWTLIFYHNAVPLSFWRWEHHVNERLIFAILLRSLLFSRCRPLHANVIFQLFFSVRLIFSQIKCIGKIWRFYNIMTKAQQFTDFHSGKSLGMVQWLIGFRFELLQGACKNKWALEV